MPGAYASNVSRIDSATSSPMSSHDRPRASSYGKYWAHNHSASPPGGASVSSTAEKLMPTMGGSAAGSPLR